MKKTIYILDAIYPQGWGGVSLASVKSQMSGIKEDDELEVVINSPGGSVFEGIAIFNFLRDYNPTIRIIGVAASIASIIAMAGKKIIMAPAATIMVHEPWTFSIGDEDYMTQVATQLNSLKRAMVEAYQIRMPEKSEKEILDWLKVEKYITGKEAKSLGLADEYNADPKKADFDMESMMKFAALMNTDNTSNQENEDTINNQGDPNMDFEAQIKSLQEIVNNKESELTQVKEQVTALQDSNTKLTEDLKQANLTTLNAKREAITAEEEAFVSKLIEAKKVTEKQKDLLVKDLVAKRLSDDETMYNEQREFLDSLAPNPLTVAQATGSRVSGSASTPSIDASDLNNPEKQTQVLKAVEALAKENNISFEEAYNQYLESVGGL